MSRSLPSRRRILIGGGVGVGLIVGYALWPRTRLTRPIAGKGEHILGGFVKVGEDGRVTVVVPQVELGHGVFTTLAQLVADELGADWRTVGVETAVAGADYANAVFAREWRDALGTRVGVSFDAALPDAVMATGASSSIRAFEGPLRDAGATAAALLCAAAAARWDADWRACETHDGFVWRGDQRMRFGEVAREAARLAVPTGVTRRGGREHRLVPASLPRLDLPAKVDGSVTFAADVRLPDMVYAAVSAGPGGDATVSALDEAAARRVTGVLDVVRTEHWVAVAATNGWAAERGLVAAAPRFAVAGPRADDRGVVRALDAALDAPGTRMASQGDVGAAFGGASVWTQSYRVGLAAHAAVETASATARLDGGRLELWLATQIPALAAAAAARALGTADDRVIVHPVMVGGSFGARYEVEIAAQAALLAQALKRPVQLSWSRAEEMRRDRFRPAAAARMAARTGPDGRIAAWFAQIAAPATRHELDARIVRGSDAHTALAAARGVAEAGAVAGAVPPYDIASYAIDHHPAMIGVPTGDWRGRAHFANAFFAECFVDEIAHATGNDPFGMRMAMLGSNPRLAQCLTRAAATGNWQGGVAGSKQGLACHAMAGSHVAVLAEARREGGRVIVDRLVAVADVGRVVNPDVVRAQIMGGLIWGMAGATGAPVTITNGTPGPLRLGALMLPRLADCPRIDIELIVSNAEPGGAGEVAVPPVAPAIAGALFAATGVRYRTLPLIQDA